MGRRYPGVPARRSLDSRIAHSAASCSPRDTTQVCRDAQAAMATVALLDSPKQAAALDEPPRTPMRWVILLSFSLATACNGLMYATEAAVEVPAESFYGIEEKDVLVLSNIFYCGFIPLVFPAIWLLSTRHGLQIAVVGGGIALAVGAGVRCLANEPTKESFEWMWAGTGILSISTPLLLGCITQVAANWFPHEERAVATSIGVLSAQGGMMVSYILPAIFVPSASSSANQAGSMDSGSGSGDVHESNVTLKHELVSYAVAQFIICAVSAVLGLLFFRTRPRSVKTATAPIAYGGGGSINPTLPEPSLQDEGGLFDNLRLCYSNPHFWVLSVVFGVTAPIYWTLGNLIDGAMIHKGSGWTETQVYTCGTLLQGASLPGFLFGGWIVDRLVDRHRAVVNVSLALATASLICYSAALAAAAKVNGTPSPALYAAVLASTAATGFFFGMFQPPALELAAECTYPASEAASCSILYLNCQIAGIGLIYLADALTAPNGATGKVNIAMSGIQIGMLLLQVVFFRGELRRTSDRKTSA